MKRDVTSIMVDMLKVCVTSIMVDTLKADVTNIKVHTPKGDITSIMSSPVPERARYLFLEPSDWKASGWILPPHNLRAKCSK